MSFRKRNAPLSSTLGRSPGTISAPEAISLPAGEHRSGNAEVATAAPGVRPSPVDGRLTISTGTASLDSLLAGHAGFALGNSLLIEESGTTDYAGSLLRFYAAEGVVQGHQVHVVGVGEYWGRELPGLVDPDRKEVNKSGRDEGKDKMKIAWRYERLGEFGAGTTSRGVLIADRDPSMTTDLIAGPVKSTSNGDVAPIQTFCHTFDLTKRLTLPSPKAITYLPVNMVSRGSPFTAIIDSLQKELRNSDPQSIHRIVVPTLLSPALYPESVVAPTIVLQFFHALRALLRLYATRLTAVISLPLTLFPRSTGLTRWMELLSDGVLELVPFPHTVDAGPPLSASGGSTVQEEKPQGMFRIHRLPVFHERGGGGVGSANVGDDLAFTLSRRRFTVKPFSLPPIEGDQDAQHGEAQGGKVKVDIDF